MINAEVTAESRPACCTSQHMCAVTILTTYEYQGVAQIIVVFLDKFLIVLPGLLMIMFVEFATKIFHDWR